ncbi:MAG: tRNA (adenosine(37)-N6)-threonylcarbamoyltransferase complex ATPase subunit type 1 TsaE [Pseudomonadota bacterium]
MAAKETHTAILPDAEATAEAATDLAGHLTGGDTIALSGPIGAGKTHFARALIQTRLAAADRLEDVPSPTFTLVQTYDDGALSLWHADLYRLGGEDEILELGIDQLPANAVLVVEWPERAPRLITAETLEIDFAYLPSDDNARRVKLTFGTAWRDRLSAIPFLRRPTDA